MTEKQQIEEMAKALRETKENARKECYSHPICNYSCKYLKRKYCLYTIQAEELYKQGYRKIDDGSVVLTEDEVFELRKDQSEVKFLKKQIQEQSRKETAKEIWKRFDNFFRPFDKKDAISIDLLLFFLESVVKQYGVEIEQ